MQQALEDWYLADKKDYEVFAAKYPLNGEIREQWEVVVAILEVVLFMIEQRELIIQGKWLGRLRRRL